MTSSLTRDLGAAASVITVARDLLHTHFHTSADGTRRDRSEWAPVITSAPVRRALLGELARWSRHIVSHGTRITSATPRDGSGLTTGQRRVLAICRPLTALITAVETASSREPVTAEDVRQLYRIPVNMLHPRSVPACTETVTGLQLGIVQCAERVRSAAATAVTDAAWSPAISPESFTQTAMCAAAISGHCEILQQSLAARAAQLGATRLRNDLVTSAAAAARARQAWLTAARAWYHIKTDAPAGLSPAAQEAADLAQWAGRLTYADSGWTPSTAPAGDCRPPHQLAPGRPHPDHPRHRRLHPDPGRRAQRPAPRTRRPGPRTLQERERVHPRPGPRLGHPARQVSRGRHRQHQSSRPDTAHHSAARRNGPPGHQVASRPAGRPASPGPRRTGNRHQPHGTGPATRADRASHIRSRRHPERSPDQGNSPGPFRQPAHRRRRGPHSTATLALRCHPSRRCHQPRRGHPPRTRNRPPRTGCPAPHVAARPSCQHGGPAPAADSQPAPRPAVRPCHGTGVAQGVITVLAGPGRRGLA
jgi:hypothetical protein